MKDPIQKPAPKWAIIEMALSDYNLYVFRESAKGPLAQSICNSKFITDYDPQDRSGMILEQIPFFVHETRLGGPGIQWEVLMLGFHRTKFERHFSMDYLGFMTWLQQFACEQDLHFAFMEGGGDSSYYAEANQELRDMFSSIPAMIQTGKPAFIQPIMYFSQRTSTNRRLSQARGIPFFTRFTSPCGGTLLVLLNQTTKAGEYGILTPGIMYKKILKSLINALH